jgi:hypothetical protein
VGVAAARAATVSVAAMACSSATRVATRSGSAVAGGELQAASASPAMMKQVIRHRFI